MIGLAEASMHVEAPQREVFDLFTTESGLCSWMAKEATVDLRPGGAWRWVHDNDVAASGEYVTVDPHDRIAFTFGWEAGPYADMGPGSTRVEVTFEPTATGTNVVVAHSAVPDAFREAHRGGWTYFLEVLADLVTGAPVPDTRLPREADGPDTTNHGGG